jgi:hypothetical protein
MAPVRRLLPAQAPEDKVRALKKGLELAAAQGLTSVHDLTLTDEDVPVFERAASEGGLKVRVYSALPLALDGMARAAQTKARIAQPRWRVGAAFGFVDGVVEARTAALFEPYPGGGTGLLHYSEAELDRVVAAFDKEGFQVVLHAVGDRAVNAALNAFERAAAANRTSGRRHRVEHLEVARAADLARFGPLGVVASTQPIFATPDQNHFEAYLPALGPERGSRALAFKSIDDARAVQAFGSNWPVAPISVLRGLYAAGRLGADAEAVGGSRLAALHEGHRVRLPRRRKPRNPRGGEGRRPRGSFRRPAARAGGGALEDAGPPDRARRPGHVSSAGLLGRRYWPK